MPNFYAFLSDVSKNQTLREKLTVSKKKQMRYPLTLLTDQPGYTDKMVMIRAIIRKQGGESNAFF